MADGAAHDADEQGICPVTKTPGKKVDSATVKCLLSVSLETLRDIQYFFCKEADCPVVYFSADGTQTYTVSEVRERIFQKEPDNGDVLVCYCFQHTLEEIRQDAKNGSNAIITAINTGIRANQCACDWRNPQGDCCLGNVRAIVKSITA